VPLGELAGRLRPGAIETWSPLSEQPALVVDLDDGRWPRGGPAGMLAQLPCVTIGRSTDPGSRPDLPGEVEAAFDVLLTGTPDPPRPWVRADDPVAEAARLAAKAADQPLASAALVALLRLTERLPTWEGVAAESSTYSMLLGSRAFLDWRAATPRRPPPEPDPRGAVLVARDGEVLSVVLNRPAARNAVDSDLRDGLVAALGLAEEDDTIRRIVLTGRGPSFSAGGDLNEFGTVGDPALANAVRLTRHPGLAVARSADRVEVRIHGAAMGSGIEIPAFASRVVADPGASFGLPELGMGLVPGAGGTFSVTARIGRHRANWFVLSGQRIDAATALAWGLVDDVEPVLPG
jgi:hypothetical protein